jgi:hypothetical protein
VLGLLHYDFDDRTRDAMDRATTVMTTRPTTLISARATMAMAVTVGGTCKFL